MVGVGVGAVTVAGTNFTANSIVLFNGVAAPTFVASTTLQFEVPDTTGNTAQLYTVQVSDPANGKSNVATFEVYAPQPGPTLFNGQLTQYMSESSIVSSLVPDVNGDGRADLVLVTLGANGVYSSPTYVPVIRHGQADGTFSASAPLVSFALQISPAEVIAGDFNGDGYTDLILFGSVGNSGSSYQVLLNDGSGNFSAGGSGVLPITDIAPAVVGDFNHDGKLDFAFGANGNQPFSLFFGNGDGTFGAPVAMGASSVGVAVSASAADLNGDGYTDIVYMDNYYNAPNQIRMLLSETGGAYTDTPIVGLPSGAYGFVVGDFNNDHIPDIFAIDQNGMGQVYLGAGNGTFTPTGTPVYASDEYFVVIPLSDPPFTVGDFDGDGNLDVAIRTQLSGPDEILFLFGDGRGNFTSQVDVSDHSSALQSGDVNGDGITDIFAAATAGFAYPSFVLGRSDRNFPSAQTLLPYTWGMLSTGNVFNNGLTDLLVGGEGDGNASDGSAPGTIYRYQPSGALASQGQAPLYSTLLVDLNGDGIADMVAFSGTSLLIWKGDGSGVYQSPINQIPLSDASPPIYFRDMDGDGYMDIVLPGVLLYGNGNFQFDVVTIPFFQNFVVGDFDGDGIPDIATGSGVMFGEDNRTFTPPMGAACPLPDNPPAFPTDVVADINGDGKDDVVMGESGPAIYLSMGRQGFELDQLLMVNGYSASVTSATVADLNGDGLLDIAVGMLGAEDLVLFTNDGTGKYQVTSYTVGVNSVFTVAPDLNGDGKPDLAFLTYNFTFLPTTVTVLLHK
jgi:hypothetical protein